MSVDSTMILQKCDDLSSKVIKDRQLFLDVYNKYCPEDEKVNIKSDIYDSKDEVEKLILKKIREAINTDFYEYAILGNNRLEDYFDNLDQSTLVLIKNDVKEFSDDLYSLLYRKHNLAKESGALDDDTIDFLLNCGTVKVEDTGDDKDFKTFLNDKFEKIIEDQEKLLEIINSHRNKDSDIKERNDFFESKDKLIGYILDKTDSIFHDYYDELIIGEHEFVFYLDSLDKKMRNEIGSELKVKCKELYHSVFKYYVNFDNLLSLSDLGVQTLIRRIASETLAIALSGASKEVCDKIYSNMSDIARDMLQDNIRGDLTQVDIRMAQTKILYVFEELEKEDNDKYFLNN